MVLFFFNGCHVFINLYYFRLNTLLKKPESGVVMDRNEKTLALKIMSLDLNTTESVQ
jgi:hypothetical protein